ncbi:hypothetical protein WN48_00119 [Eufriesea mexicana]|uniref:Uncharacterized protein n=1 Tax=Eufriesea mexicana TaxID=516756 RepID=A0A310SR83_9HYME|nr:hypothetical protein WN48_00119 [Eufriesea mexicana]
MGFEECIERVPGSQALSSTLCETTELLKAEVEVVEQYSDPRDSKNKAYVEPGAETSLPTIYSKVNRNYCRPYTERVAGLLGPWALANFLSSHSSRFFISSQQSFVPSPSDCNNVSYNVDVISILHLQFSVFKRTVISSHRPNRHHSLLFPNDLPSDISLSMFRKLKPHTVITASHIRNSACSTFEPTIHDPKSKASHCHYSIPHPQFSVFNVRAYPVHSQFSDSSIPDHLVTALPRKICLLVNPFRGNKGPSLNAVKTEKPKASRYYCNITCTYFTVFKRTVTLSHKPDHHHSPLLSDDLPMVIILCTIQKLKPHAVIAASHIGSSACLMFKPIPLIANFQVPRFPII